MLLIYLLYIGASLYSNVIPNSTSFKKHFNVVDRKDIEIQEAKQNMKEEKKKIEKKNEKKKNEKKNHKLFNFF